MSAVSSPCVKLCEIDAASGLCRGCGRSLDEIGRWAALDETARRAIMATLPARLGNVRTAAIPSPGGP